MPFNGGKYCALSKDHCDDFNSKLINMGLEFKAVRCFNDEQIFRITKRIKILKRKRIIMYFMLFYLVCYLISVSRSNIK